MFLRFCYHAKDLLRGWLTRKRMVGYSTCSMFSSFVLCNLLQLISITKSDPVQGTNRTRWTRTYGESTKLLVWWPWCWWGRQVWFRFPENGSATVWAGSEGTPWQSISSSNNHRILGHTFNSITMEKTVTLEKVVELIIRRHAPKTPFPTKR